MQEFNKAASSHKYSIFQDVVNKMKDSFPPSHSLYLFLLFFMTNAKRVLGEHIPEKCLHPTCLLESIHTLIKNSALTQLIRCLYLLFDSSL